MNEVLPFGMITMDRASGTPEIASPFWSRHDQLEEFSRSAAEDGREPVQVAFATYLTAEAFHGSVERFASGPASAEAFNCASVRTPCHTRTSSYVAFASALPWKERPRRRSGLENVWMPFVTVNTADFSNAPLAASRRMARTVVVPSLCRSNVAEMWYCFPSAYGARFSSYTLLFPPLNASAQSM